ncbi:phytoene/squalene synthase family protein [Hutsoniella sourekii]|uniref:phytoene/squalene synthase family protein n=1 Tax=Hutsoniella sourekii TaxID=87650 RepID=UPI00048624AB|nr:phytoene/squalene synthase family protein [Hutsoniella sourekii]
MTDSKLIQDSYDYCIQVMKHHSKSFYYAFSQLSNDRLQAIASIYAFCRTADDLVDEETSTDQQAILDQLDRLKEAIIEVSSGQRLDLPFKWWPAFQETLVNYQIPDKGFLLQLKGQVMDLNFSDLKTLEDLVTYSKHVAGSVGLMLLPILKRSDLEEEGQDLEAACLSLGVAMQVTNILRDVGEDLKERNRVYIPEEVLHKHGLAKADLLNLIADPQDPDRLPRFQRVWEELATLADDCYQAFWSALVAFAPEAQVPLASAALIYQAIQDQVRQANYNCLTQKCHTSQLTKIRKVQEAKQRLRQMNQS